MQNPARSVVLDELYKKCGFQFQENELSPRIRNEIGMMEARIQELWRTHSQLKNAKSGKTTSLIIMSIFIIIGLILELIVSTGRGIAWFSVAFGLISLGIAWLIYKYLYKNQSENYAVLEQQYSIKFKYYQNGMETLWKGIFNELSLIHEQKVSPKIKQEVVQYIISTKFEFGKNGALVIECPYCKASSELTSKTNPIKCSYCGKEYIIPNKVLQLL